MKKYTNKTTGRVVITNSELNQRFAILSLGTSDLKDILTEKATPEEIEKENNRMFEIENDCFDNQIDNHFINNHNYQALKN